SPPFPYLVYAFISYSCQASGCVNIVRGEGKYVGTLFIASNKHQAKLANNVTLSAAKGLAPRAARSFALLRMTGRTAKDDRVVLPDALWPTQAHRRVHLTPIALSRFI